MSTRHNYFKQTAPKQDEWAIQQLRAEQLSKADFGVIDGWKKLPKWLERWLVHHHQDWFDAVESLSNILKIGSHE